jgi:hypothetical protein
MPLLDLTFFTSPAGAFAAFAVGLFGAIPVILGPIAGLVKRRKNKSFTAVFGTCRAEGILVVVPTGGRCADVPLSALDAIPPASKKSAGPNTITTVEDALAKGIVLEEMLKAGLKVSISVHAEAADSECRGNIFLICGPVGNRISRALLREIGSSQKPLPYRFMKRDRWQLERANAVFGTTESSDMIDFALIAKVDNPWSAPNKPTKAYICAGIEGLGTLGSTIYLVTKPDAFTSLLRKEKKPEESNFSAVVKVTKRAIGLPEVSVVDFLPH